MPEGSQEKPKPFEEGKEYQTIYDPKTRTITSGEIIPGGEGISDIFIPDTVRKLKKEPVRRKKNPNKKK